MKLTKKPVGRPRKETPVAVTHPPLQNPYPRLTDEEKTMLYASQLKEVEIEQKIAALKKQEQDTRTIERVLRAFANDLEESFSSSPALPELEAAITLLMHRRGFTFLIPNN